MARAEKLARGTLVGLLRANDGVEESYANLLAAEDFAAAPLTAAEVLEQYVSADLADKGSSVRYPTVQVYCEKVSNKLREKFRRFSGTATLAVEIRVSHEHMEEVGSQLQVYVDSVTDVLDRKRGSWAEGVFYTGGYEVIYSPVKRGGRNYLQSALVRLEVHISMN